MLDIDPITSLFPGHLECLPIEATHDLDRWVAARLNMAHCGWMTNVTMTARNDRKMPHLATICPTKTMAPAGFEPARPLRASGF